MCLSPKTKQNKKKANKRVKIVGKYLHKKAKRIRVINVHVSLSLFLLQRASHLGQELLLLELLSHSKIKVMVSTCRLDSY